MTPSEQIDLARLAHDVDDLRRRISDELSVLATLLRERAAGTPLPVPTLQPPPKE